MKRILARRWVAAVLCLAVLFASLLVNTRVGLGREVRDVMALLYDGETAAYNQAVYDFMSRNANGYTRLCANLAGVNYPGLVIP